jgi:hypothetical protein
MYTVRNDLNSRVINFMLWLQGHVLGHTNTLPNKERLQLVLVMTLLDCLTDRCCDIETHSIIVGWAASVGMP